ncbi:hypothetical protein KFL_000580140 [Klebsormidium nitens]|uniref:MYND-type domain-containing protein n=1 Tax=Klebsormidium nitens TaxID=105231 RepID=A0A1Y1HPR9_KLENI|nr:hypothetical protein KFL_000580140 [Klebsormidium nitens]|eukprot:GAQ80620.1 hypothetical protein KFL_000580140 [Klebsormidium nitens]
MDAAMQADPARLAKREETVRRGLNMDLEAVRKTAIQRAEEALSSSASTSSVSIPPEVHPSDSGTEYDLEKCVETLKSPVTVNRLCAEDLERAFHLFCTAVKVGMDTAERTIWGFAGDLSFQDHMHVLMMMLKQNASGQDFYTVMVRSGLAGLTLEDWLVKNLVPQNVALVYLDTAIDLATKDSTTSERLEGLRTLAAVLSEGGPGCHSKFHEAGALEPLIARFLTTEFSLDDLLLPRDRNLAAWMLKVFGALVLPSSVMRTVVNGQALPEQPAPGAAEAIETLFERGVVRKILDMLAHMVARADDVRRDVRLIDFCKMLEILTTVLGNLSNKEAMFFDELRPLPDFASSLTWLITHWNYDLHSGLTAINIVNRMLTTGRSEDRAAASEIVRQEGVLKAVAEYVNNAPEEDFAIEFGDSGPVQKYDPLPDLFISFLSVEDLQPGALTPAVVSTLVRIAAGPGAAAATRSQAADLLRRFLGEGLVSPDQTGVHIPCDECGAEKFPGELKRCSRCKEARYCSPECQRASWKEHKKNCVEALPASAH